MIKGDLVIICIKPYWRITHITYHTFFNTTYLTLSQTHTHTHTHTLGDTSSIQKQSRWSRWKLYNAADKTADQELKTLQWHTSYTCSKDTNKDVVHVSFSMQVQIMQMQVSSLVGSRTLSKHRMLVGAHLWLWVKGCTDRSEYFIQISLWNPEWWQTASKLEEAN